MNKNINFFKKPILNFNNYSNVFKGEFKHDYGHAMMLHCACYHLYFDKDHAKLKSKKTNKKNKTKKNEQKIKIKQTTRLFLTRVFFYTQFN